MKKVAGRLRLDLAQYRELEAFAQFGSELDAATQQSLARGERMVATLNQPQYQPWPTEEQVVAIYAGINGYLDKVPVGQVPRFQEELRETLRAEGAIYQTIRESGDLSDETAAKLDAALEEVRRRASTSRRRQASSAEPSTRRWPRFRTTSGGSAPSATRARSRGRWSSSRRRSSAARRRGSRRCARTPTRCAS